MKIQILTTWNIKKERHLLMKKPDLNIISINGKPFGTKVIGDYNNDKTVIMELDFEE